MKAMHQHHKLQYSEHIHQMTKSFIFTEISLVVTIIQLILGFWHHSCRPSTNPPDEYYAMNDNNEGICSIFYIPFKNISATGIEAGIYISNNIVLLPVFTFLVLNKPHDCFSCLAKDPDRTYSIY